MDWNQSKFGYYLDFVLVPFLACLLLLGEYLSRGITPRLLVSTVAAYGVWTFLEYWIHRTLFHVVMRKAHEIHHKRPASYVAAPWRLVSVLHIGLLATAAFADSPVATGIFLGLEAGYFGYIAVHDAIHHRKMKSFGWLRRKFEHHNLHHCGVEKNFGVVFHFWDRVFKTYQDPQKDGRFRKPRYGF